MQPCPKEAILSAFITTHRSDDCANCRVLFTGFLIGR
jgi:hypothetical protein